MFVFIFGVSEVNAMLAEVYFSDTSEPSMLDFRKQLTRELNYNTYGNKNESRVTRKVVEK